MMRDLIRGDGTWAMSLGVWIKPNKPATRAKRFGFLCTRNMPYHALQSPDPHRVSMLSSIGPAYIH